MWLTKKKNPVSVSGETIENRISLLKSMGLSLSFSTGQWEYRIGPDVVVAITPQFVTYINERYFYKVIAEAVKNIIKYEKNGRTDI